MSNSKDIIDSLSGSHDFGDGKGNVPAHRHINSDGNAGGWVAETVSFFEANEVWIDYHACVFDEVMLIGNVEIKGRATVCGKAHVRNADIEDRACVKGNAKVGSVRSSTGRTIIKGHAVITGNAQIIGESVVEENAYVGGVGVEIMDAHISGNARIFGGVINSASILENATVTGSPFIDGCKTIVRGNAFVGDEVRLRGSHVVQGDAVLTGILTLNGKGSIDENDPMSGALVTNTYIASKDTSI
jgi:bifunctional N-acetylglucosamine-1-phosphate-uridyltransferase/glucosamine-1-phosphate-acetyltransferase GlmU-like protein